MSLDQYVLLTVFHVGVLIYVIRELMAANRHHINALLAMIPDASGKATVHERMARAEARYAPHPESGKEEHKEPTGHQLAPWPPPENDIVPPVPQHIPSIPWQSTTLPARESATGD